jgi:hypothetical protein
MPIRHEIFETNRSSTHSLSLQGIGVRDTYFGDIYPGGENRLSFLGINGYNFGWQWEIWDSPALKALYLYLDNNIPEFRERLVSLLKTKLNVDEIHFETERSYIDHDSHGTTAGFRTASDEELWDFMTLPGNQIRGGNDNEEGPWERKNRYWDEEENEDSNEGSS